MLSVKFQIGEFGLLVKLNRGGSSTEGAKLPTTETTSTCQINSKEKEENQRFLSPLYRP